MKTPQSLTCCCLFVLLLISALSTHAATISVTSNSTPGCTLADAIRAANADAPRGDCSAGSGADTIRIVPNTINAGSELQTITSTVTIQSSDSTTKVIRRSAGSGNQFRVFDVNGGDLRLRLIEVSGGFLRGFLDGGGAGIRIRDGTLALDRVIVRDNALENTNQGGGGLLTENSAVSIVDSQFINNRILNDDGNLIRGAAVYLETSQVSVSKTTFAANHLTGSGGVLQFVNSDVSILDSFYDYRTTTASISSANTGVYFSIVGGTVNLTNTTIAEDRVTNGDPVG